jgi:hypothetical protein
MNCLKNLPELPKDEQVLRIDGVLQSHFQVDSTQRRVLNYSLEIRGNYDHIRGMQVLIEKLESEVALIREYVEKLRL